MNDEPSSTRPRRALLATMILALVPGSAVGPAPAHAQEADRVRVFLDCQTRGCPQQEFRTEIGFVDWVRDRTAADLHVILTSQDSGGGTEYVFDLIGRNDFEDSPLTVTANVAAGATQDERLAALTRTFKAALAGYVARRGYADQIEITGRQAGAAGAPRLDPAADPWRMWVFTLSANGEAEGEERQRQYEARARFNANRTTPDWKLNIGLNGQLVEQRFQLSDGEFTNRVDEWGLDVLAVRSLSPHWSAGTETLINSSSQINRDVGGRVAGAVEWNYYPYEEANRRQLLVHYQVGYSHIEYEEETVFGKLQDDLFDQRIVGAWQARQPWGDGSFLVRYSNYLHDWSRYSLSVRGDVSVRLLRGLELDVSGGYELIRDQLYLSAEELDDEEVVAGGRQLPTGYEYDIRVGLSYRFGSIFNNVVNNRFPSLNRRFF